jgi:hypothetical protein
MTTKPRSAKASDCALYLAVVDQHERKRSRTVRPVFGRGELDMRFAEESLDRHRYLDVLLDRRGMHERRCENKTQ